MKGKYAKQNMFFMFLNILWIILKSVKQNLSECSFLSFPWWVLCSAPRSTAPAAWTRLKMRHTITTWPCEVLLWDPTWKSHEITDGETRDDIAEKLGMAEWPCCSRRSVAMFGFGQAVVAAALRRHGDSVALLGIKAVILRISTVVSLPPLFLLWHTAATVQTSKESLHMNSFPQILLLRLPRALNVMNSNSKIHWECNSKTPPTPAFWGWCHHRMGWTAWMPAKGWRLGCRAWQKLTEFHWVDF